MIISKSFIWAHLPKTGGTATTRIFNQFPDLIVYQDNERSHAKHDTFKQKEQKFVKNDFPQKRIMNFRKLPEWLISIMFHMQRCANIPFNKDNYKNGAVFLDMGGVKKWYNIDELLKGYLDKPIDYFIRVEYLALDFIKAINNFKILSPGDCELIKSIRCGVGNYDKSKEYFTKEEISQIYDDCPIWSNLEKTLYK